MSFKYFNLFLGGSVTDFAACIDEKVLAAEIEEKESALDKYLL